LIIENAGMTAASETMSDIKRYMERQAAKEVLNAPRQGKNRPNNNGNGNGSSNNNAGAILIATIVVAIAAAATATPTTLAVAVATAMHLIATATNKQGLKQQILALWPDMLAIHGAIVT
jgi:hypothetical protein